MKTSDTREAQHRSAQSDRPRADVEQSLSQLPRSAVAVLAKAPHIGRVKTRMREALSDAQALALHRWCIDELDQHLLPEITRACEDRDQKHASLFFVTDPHPQWDQLHVSAPPQRQAGAHLGERMWAALCESFEWLEGQGSHTGDTRQDAVMLLGTDSPHLDPRELAVGLATLCSSPEPLAIVGPAEDGGYYTIGCNRAALPSLAPLFSAEIKWGGSEVLAETRRRAQRHGVTLHDLSMNFDLDRPADLKRLEALDPERAARLWVHLTPHALSPPQDQLIASRYRDALESLFGLTRFGERQDLSAPRAINRALGAPLERYRNILVGGTNGKGSTCAALLKLSERCGVRVGCFTSPHLISFRERIRIGDELISPERVIEGVQAVFEAAQRAQITLSFFEAAWALAAWHFAQEEVDWVVWEVGLGGRLDATNVCEPEVSAIVSVSLDHTHILGESLDEIAAEKAPIFRERGVALTAAQGDALAAVRHHAPAHLITLEELIDTEVWDELTRAGTAPQSADLMVGAEHGRRNLALAWSIARAAGWSPPDWEIARSQREPWWSQVKWPGRLERLQGVWLDCAHNPDSARQVSAWLESYVGETPSIGDISQERRARHLIVGMSADKDQETVLTTLATSCEKITFTSPVYPRCAQADTLLALYHQAVEPRLQERGLSLPEISVTPSIIDALRDRDPLALTLVTGSCFAVGEARAWLLGVPFPEGGIVTKAR